MKTVVAVLLCVLAAMGVAEEEAGSVDQEVLQFKSEKGNMQRVLACWMTFRENFPKPHTPSLPIIKQCLQRLSQEDVRTRIISFLGTKPVTPKKLSQILTEQEIAALLTREEGGEASEFDKMIMKYMVKYDGQMESKMPQPKEVRQKLDEQVAKRQSYFLGLIPANKYTAMMLLIMGGMFLLFLCSCFRFRSRKDKRKDEEKKQLQQQQQQREKVDLRKIGKFANDQFFKKYDKPKKK